MQIGERYGRDGVYLLFGGLSQQPDRMQRVLFVVEQTERAFRTDADQLELVGGGEEAERFVRIEFEYDRRDVFEWMHQREEKRQRCGVRVLVRQRSALNEQAIFGRQYSGHLQLRSESIEIN